MIYLDYAATTPLDSRVFDAMLPYFTENFGNPSSTHRYGQKAEAAVETARETIAGILNCRPDELIFTSCGSESDNLALRGVALARRKQSGANRILTARAEHHAVSKTAERLEKEDGFQVEWLPLDEFGRVTAQAVEQALSADTALVSVMYSNNEIGTINPICQIAEICRKYAVPLHTDAVQAAAYLPVDVEALGVDLLSLGAHKFYGPKGIGALYIRKGTPIQSILTGGGQEFGLRAGTHNVPLIVGLAEALRLAHVERPQRVAHLLPLRDAIIATVQETIPDVRLTGHPTERVPNHASFVFKGVDGNLLINLLDAAGFACSSGSACKTGNPQPSEVLTSLGLPREWALGSLRVTLGLGTTSEDVQAFLQTLPEVVEKARELSVPR
ncbi:MAG: cysteine desulfurase NifS [Anaerolineae bacterium]|nr:MAG: cysteine desulfurase NifS [Anaerolineae bacterium]